MIAPLSAEQQARYDRIEAAEPAPESITERLADALAAELESLGLSGEVSARASLYLAGAAIAVLRGPSVADEALRRVEAECDELDRLGDELGWAVGAHYTDAADRIRAALNGGER